MCRGLKSLDIHSFIKEVTGSFQYTCQRLQNADESEYLNLFQVVLTMARQNVSIASPEGCNMCVQTEKTNFLMEFKVNSTAEEALTQTERYRKNFHDKDREVLCMGINYQFTKAVRTCQHHQDQLLCNWMASLYSENGTLKKNYRAQKLVLTCA